METSKILCPNCKSIINVNDVLYHQLEEKFTSKAAEEAAKFQKLVKEFSAEKEDFEAKKLKADEMFNEQLHAKLKEEKAVIQNSLKLKIEEEKADEIKLLQNELNEKLEQIKELNKAKALIARLQREKEEIQSSVEADAEKTFSIKLKAEKESIRKMEEEKSEFKLKELQSQLEAQKALTKEMQRKQEQGSVQLQGEVQELAIEDWLKTSFPLDTINEVKKGARGADCLQIVNTRGKQNCGSIYYESKRTKDFGNNWIQKFKDDMNEVGANIGILVTDAKPVGTERLCLKDGIWICSYEEFKGLCCVIREHIVSLDLAITSQENKGEKMAMLYDYLTSNEFRLQIENIIEGYTQMQNDLDTERRSITGHWKKREKQLNKVLRNTNYMYSSLRGIAGNAIQTVQALEHPSDSFNLEQVEQADSLLDEL